MKLPNHQFKTHDIIQQMNIPADGPEMLMDAEDYLQPQSISDQSPEATPVVNSSDKVSNRSPAIVKTSGNGIIHVYLKSHTASVV